MKWRSACPWWDSIAHETACVSPGHARSLVFVIQGLAVSLSWCCSAWFVLELSLVVVSLLSWYGFALYLLFLGSFFQL